MVTREYTTDRFRSLFEQDEQTIEWQYRYTKLIGLLGVHGTEVKTERVLEQDKDIPPFRFVRDAVHDFIFPKGLEVAGIEGLNSSVIDDTPGYAVRRESMSFRFDESSVSGLLRVYYDDAESHIDLSLTDLIDGGSQIASVVIAEIDQIFDPSVTQQPNGNLAPTLS